MLRVTTQWGGIPGSPYFTVLHFSGTTEAQAEAAHAGVVALFNGLSNYRDSRMTGQVLTEVENVDPVTGNVIGTFAVTPVTLAAGTSGAAQPFVVQGLVQARTGVYDAGREVRGRTFLPGTLDKDDFDGAPSSAYQAAIAGVWNTFRTDLEALGAAPVVWSPTKGLAAEVSVYTVWNQWAILRSRRD